MASLVFIGGRDLEKDDLYQKIRREFLNSILEDDLIDHNYFHGTFEVEIENIHSHINYYRKTGEQVDDLFLRSQIFSIERVINQIAKKFMKEKYDSLYLGTFSIEYPVVEDEADTVVQDK